MLADIKMALSRPIAPKLLCLILVILLGWQLTTGSAAFFLLDKAVSVRHDQIAEVKTKAVTLNTGLKAAFFGDYVPKNLSDADVKQSMLNLTVVGIMFSDSEESSHVIIRTGSGQEQPFRVGDSLPGGAVIKRITNDGVLIGHNGSLESLSLPKNALTFEPPPKPLRSSE